MTSLSHDDKSLAAIPDAIESAPRLGCIGVARVRHDERLVAQGRGHGPGTGSGLAVTH